MPKSGMEFSMPVPVLENLECDDEENEYYDVVDDSRIKDFNEKSIGSV